MKKLLILAAGAGIATLSAQSLSLQVMASSGTTFSAASSQLEFTIGEPVTTTLTTGGNIVTQGFHQPEINISSVHDYNSEYTFNLYPNPTEQYVTIESSKETHLKAEIFDASGKVILSTSVFLQKTTLDVQTLAAGSYILRLTNDQNKPLHSYTLIKK